MQSLRITTSFWTIYQRSRYLLQEKMEKVIERESLGATHSVCRVVPTELEENLGDYAALAVAQIGKVNAVR